MINHVRTLLLNRRPADVRVISGGNEIIDPQFSPVTLYGPLYELHQLVVSEQLSSDEANFKMFSILQLLHMPDFLPYITKFDDRITYDIENNYYITEVAAGRLNYKFNGNALYDQFLSKLAGPALGRLFKPIPGYEEDLDTFRQCWFGGDNKYIRLSAAVLALVYQMEQERLNANTI